MTDFSTHDLLELRSAPSGDLPPWLTGPLARWCVVRRGTGTEKDEVPAGFRGHARHERFAASVARSNVKRALKPEELKLRIESIASERLLSFGNSLRALHTVLGDLCWGPAGSVAFELATGIPSIHPHSDIDIVITLAAFPKVSTAAELSRRVQAAAARTDVLIEVPHGGFVLREYARGRSFVLRTGSGPALYSSAAEASRQGD